MSARAVRAALPALWHQPRRRLQAVGPLCARRRNRFTAPVRGGVSACAVRWLGRVLALRRRRPTRGARKLRWLLRQNYPRARLPAERTLGRWLRQAGLVARPSPPAQPGPRLPRRGRLRARRPHDVWTINFKGRGRAGDGAALAPLTVRDLASRQVLAVRLLVAPSERAGRAVLTRLFRRHGLPARPLGRQRRALRLRRPARPVAPERVVAAPRRARRVFPARRPAGQRRA